MQFDFICQEQNAIKSHFGGEPMKFSEKLKEARKNAGLKQPELAKAVGVSVRTIASYETGETYPR